MAELPKKLIPWQDRERIGGIKAFLMTLFEALFSPIDYFEKLEVKDDLSEPLILLGYNSFYLVGPLIPQMLILIPFLTVIAILIITPLFVLALAFVLEKILAMFGEIVSFKEMVYVLSFSSPAFLLCYVPVVGYGFAAGLYLIFCGIGLASLGRIGYLKILPALVLVPLVVLLPYGGIRFSRDWQVRHPVIDTEREAERILVVLSIAAENYSLKNKGTYPLDNAMLVQGPEKYLSRNYCGEKFYDYQIICDFRSFGYFLKAEPTGWTARGKKTYYVTTGGKLRQE